jgi:hypothetical protein
MNATPTHCPTSLSEAERKFRRWRRSSRRGQRIPAVLWSLAVGLAGEHGVSKTARRLGLDYYALKKRAQAVDTPVVEPHRPTFVEVALGSPTAAMRCVVELADGAGVRLRVELPSLPAGELGALARALWAASR